MQLLKLVGVFVGVFICTSATAYSPGNTTQRVLSRRRRYVAFPEGSSVSAAICLTIGVIGNPNVNYLSWAENWGVAYDLPNYAWARKHAQGFSNNTKALVQRRSRRELYEKVELAIDSMGFHGNACVSRALCESVKFVRGLGQRKGNMIEELIKTIFSFPSAHMAHDESAEHYHYAHVYRRAKRSEIDCSREFAECQFSLLELALGKYSMSSPKIVPGFLFM